MISLHRVAFHELKNNEFLFPEIKKNDFHFYKWIQAHTSRLDMQI